MDWTTIFSSAVGTMGGTLITVCITLKIYHSERKDIDQRNRKKLIVDSAIRCMQLVNSNTASIINLNSLMFSMANVEVKEAQISLYPDVIRSTTNSEELTSELYSNLLVLENISKYKIEKIALPYINKATEITYGHSFKNEDEANRVIKSLKRQGNKLIEELQEILKENIEEQY